MDSFLLIVNRINQGSNLGELGIGNDLPPITGSSATFVLTLNEAPLFAVSQSSRDHTSDA